MTIIVENKQLVLPGEALAKGDYVADSNTYSHDKTVYSTKIGIVMVTGRRLHVVPIKGRYIPHVDDQVIGRVFDVGLSGWNVDILSPYPAMLPASEAVNRRQSGLKMDLKKILNVADLIVAKVISFDRTRDPLLTIKGENLGKINFGKIIQISPTKVPRLIGRSGSMINMIKNETHTQILIGQNGLIILSSKSSFNERIATSAINKIEREAHLDGLTDKVRDMIKEEMKKRNDGTN